MLQHTHAQRRGRIVETDGQEALPVVEDHRQIARPAFAALADDGLIEQPGMAPAQGVLRRGRDAQRQATLGGRRDEHQIHPARLKRV